MREGRCDVGRKVECEKEGGMRGWMRGRKCEGGPYIKR